MSPSHSLKVEHPHGTKSLYAKRDSAANEAHALCVPLSTHPTNHPSNVRAGVENFDAGVEA